MLPCSECDLAGRCACEKASVREFGDRRRCSIREGITQGGAFIECLADELASPVLDLALGPAKTRPSLA